MKKPNKEAPDPQARKYQLTINNPDNKGFTHAAIHAAIQSLKSTIYYCMADERGAEGTLHTHIFIAFAAPVRFSTIKNLFPAAHIEKALGSCEENRNYIMKTGKWVDSAKGETSIPGTFEEYGQLPHDGQRSSGGGIMTTIYAMVKAGASDVDILESYPQAMMYLDRIQRVRQALVAEKYAHEFRQLEVSYVWGPTGTGKTRGVMEKYGYENVSRVTDYSHPFERYRGEDIILFDEYRSQLDIASMLNYLDGYPVQLPCRYANKQACYTKAYIISNIPLSQQYIDVQYNEPETWAAFLRRIHHVVEYTADGYNVEPVAVQEVLPGFVEINDDGIPF